MSEPFRVDRRTAMKWVAMASTLPWLQRPAIGTAAPASGKGYGTDPRLNRVYKPGELWPLTLPPFMRQAAAALCDIIIPADEHSPSASSVGVVDFIDEWISAPYEAQRTDRRTILEGLGWLEIESKRRFKKFFVDLSPAQKAAICDDICYLPRAKPAFQEAAKFFATFRDLTAGGFYTTPAGSKDIRYIGNVALERFDGPPAEVLRKVGLPVPSK
jgi:gluconate 2-dehydrogenase subunit 3-like protein